MAADTVIALKHCIDCPYNNTSATKGVAADLGLCKRCWVDKGRPSSQPDKICRMCTDGEIRGRGPSLANQLCMSCFWTEAEKTWRSVLPDLPEDIEFEDTTLFIGNLDYKCEAHEVEALVRHELGRRSDLPDNFAVRLAKGGLQGDHGINKKVFKHFAHIKFDIVDDAYKMLRKCSGLYFRERELKVHPAVKRGTCMWLGGKWWKSIMYRPIDTESEVLGGRYTVDDTTGVTVLHLIDSDAEGE